MAFVVEDGTGLENSTSYVDLDFANAYADSFFAEDDYIAWGGATDATKERLLNRATMYLDRTYVFNGQKGSSTQALQFPREYLYDSLGNLIDGVPAVIKQATCLVALRMLHGITLDPDVDRKTKREKIDAIDITYADNSSMYTKYTEIDNLLKSAGVISSNRTGSVVVRLVQR
jgi:hypothetical protein